MLGGLRAEKCVASPSLPVARSTPAFLARSGLEESRRAFFKGSIPILRQVRGKQRQRAFQSPLVESDFVSRAFSRRSEAGRAGWWFVSPGLVVGGMVRRRFQPVFYVL
jgi:hypothetical protein